MQEQASTVRMEGKAHFIFQSRLYHNMQEVIAGISHRIKQPVGVYILYAKSDNL
jgi:hypothetical protein